MNNNKKNIILSLICGELTSWFLIFVIKNPYVEEFQGLAKIEGLVWILPVLFPIIFALGILIGRVVSKFIKIVYQIVKFLEVGVLNTFIDIGILNLLVWRTGITSGGWLTPLNTFSFICAAINSYYWNKFWTFETREGTKGKEFVQFLVISLIGWGINTGIVVLGTTYLNSTVAFSAGAWVNIMKIVATLVSMVWNFLGYKFIVFKR